MGFMTAAGAFSESFGKAFSNSYGQTQQIKAQRERDAQEQENDIFKMTLKEQMDNKEELRKQKAKEAGITATAQSIAEATGGPPSEIAKRLLAGADTSAVTDWAKSQDWKKTNSADLGMVSPPTSAANANNSGRNVNDRLPGIDTDAGVAAAQGATAQQMEDVFPTSPVPRTDPTTFEAQTPTETPTVLEAPMRQPMGQSYDGLVGTPKTKELTFDQQKDKVRTQLVNEVDPDRKAQLKQQLIDMAQAESIGEDPKSLDTDGLYLAAASDDPILAAQANKALAQKERAETLREARKGGGGLFVYDPAQSRLVQAEVQIGEDGRKTYLNNEGAPIEGTILPDDRFYKKYDEVQSLAGDKQVLEYNAKLAATANVAKASSELAQIVETNPGVLTKTASLVEIAKGLSDEGKTALNILRSENRQNIQPEQLDALDQDLNFMSKETNDLGKASAVYQAKKQVLAMRIAQMNGQSGRDMSNADFQRELDTIQPSTDREGVVQNLASITSTAVGNLRPLAATLNNDPRITNFKNQYGSVPIEGGVIAEDFDTYVKRMNDPLINSSLEYLKSREGNPLAPEAETKPTNPVSTRKTSNGVSWSIE